MVDLCNNVVQKNVVVYFQSICQSKRPLTCTTTWCTNSQMCLLRAGVFVKLCLQARFKLLHSRSWGGGGGLNPHWR